MYARPSKNFIIDGLDFDVYSKDGKVNFKSNLFMMHNAMNIGLVYTILNEIEEYDYNSYMKVLNTITIPGRCETYNFNNRKIIISYGLDPELVNLKKYKDNKQINQILVVTGASGLGHKTWGKEFSSDEYIEEKMEGMSFAYNYIQKYADCVYITSSDSGATNKEELINQIFEIVNTLSEKEQYVLQSRYCFLTGEKVTLSVCAEHLNITKERVRQIQERAIRKIRRQYYAKQHLKQGNTEEYLERYKEISRNS